MQRRACATRDDGEWHVTASPAPERVVQVRAGQLALEGNLVVPAGAPGVVLFAHGSGSSRHRPGNRFGGEVLQRAGLATLLIHLLSPEEKQRDNLTRALRFDIGLLAKRLV